MKKKFIFIGLFIFFIIDCNAKDKKDSYLQEFFACSQYKTEYYKFDGINICFSYIYAENSSEIITKGIIYSYFDNEVKYLLVIENEKILDNSSLLFQGTIVTQKFYGYKVNIIEKNKCITTEFYTNDGKNVTDGPTFLWNSGKQAFSKYEVDRSQW